jgi:hypothetical protein
MINKTKESALTAERLRELLNFDATTGEFRWRVTRRGTARAGSVAGTPDGKGYSKITIDGRRYKAHRLALLYMTGSWPAACIDHIDGNPLNNAFENLREATVFQNQHNRRISRNNTSGVKGVCLDRQCGRWQARLSFGGKRYYLGLFDNIEDAAAAIEEARRKYHGAFARTRLITSVDLTGSQLQTRPCSRKNSRSPLQVPV